EELRERVDARVGHLHRTESRLVARATRGNREAGECAEHGALPSTRIADESDLHRGRKLTFRPEAAHVLEALPEVGQRGDLAIGGVTGPARQEAGSALQV